MAATDLPCLSFPTHSVPDITRNDYIVAVCTVPQPYCQADSLAFHAADLAAFKHLFSTRLSHEQQAWLSACDPRHLPLLRHGTKNVLGAFDSGVYIESAPSALLDMFVDQIKRKSNEIRFRSDKAPSKLIILVFGPTSPQQDILKELPRPLSVEDRARFLYIEDLREIVGHGIDSMLVTPNMHAGGWVINGALTRSKPSSRSAQEREYALRRIVRNTAPLFVDSSFTTLTQESSPMRLEPDRGNDRSMMPASPTRAERDSHVKFYGTVHEACFGSILAAPRMDTFNFTVDLDNWIHLWGPRRGPHLVEHAERWRTLPRHDERAVSRSPFPFYCFGTTQESQLIHLKTLAFVLRPEWTRDEVDRANQELQVTLDTAFGLSSIADGVSEQEIERAYIHFVHTSVYRQALMHLADATVELCGLAPLEARCRRWEAAWTRPFGFEIDNPELNERVLPAIRALLPLMPQYTPRLASPITYGAVDADFVRPVLYLWRVIAASVVPEPDMMVTIRSNIHRFEDIVNQLRQRTPQDLLRSPWVAGAGYALVKRLDKGPDSARLSAGPLTTLATGVAQMPSEMMKIRADSWTMPHAGWRGSSRRAGGSSISTPGRHRRGGFHASRRAHSRGTWILALGGRSTPSVPVDARFRTTLAVTQPEMASPPENEEHHGAVSGKASDGEVKEENLIYFSDDDMPEATESDEGIQMVQEDDLLH